MTNDRKHSRRDFLRYAAGFAGTAATLGMTAQSYSRVMGANDRLRVGIVGFGDRARHGLVPAFQQLTDEMNCEITVLSDIWSRRREEGSAFLLQLTGKAVSLARNSDELYGMQGVDAVIISTPDFQHARQAAEAVRAGCHAYVEAPFAQTMEDAREALLAIQETGKIVQIGTQRRSAPSYWKAIESLRSGRFGDLSLVEMTCNVHAPDRWRRAALVESARREEIDWGRYLMHFSGEAWDPRKFVEFRLFQPYSTGLPGQLMVHQLDALHGITGVDCPRSVVAAGGIYRGRDGRTNSDTVTAVLDYGPVNETANGFQVIYNARIGNAAGSMKEVYHSKGGTLDVLQGVATNVVVPSAKVDPVTAAHLRNWIECIRTGQQPHADVCAGYKHSIALCMITAALETGRRVTFDLKEQRVVTG